MQNSTKCTITGCAARESPLMLRTIETAIVPPPMAGSARSDNKINSEATGSTNYCTGNVSLTILLFRFLYLQ